MRTTINIATPILEELRKIQSKEGGSLGQIVSRLLAGALKAQQPQTSEPRPEWVSKSMRARVDLADKDSVYALLDEDSP